MNEAWLLNILVYAVLEVLIKNQSNITMISLIGNLPNSNHKFYNVHQIA